MKDILRRVFRTDAGVLLVGLAAAVFFWVFDAVIDTVVLGEGDFLRNMFAPSVHESWMRLIVMGLLVVISVYSRRYIARLRRSEESFRRSEERFELASRGSSDGLWDWPDVDKDDEWWSPRFFELLGYADGEVSPGFSNFKSMLHPDDLERMQGALEYHFKTRELFNVEYRLRTKSGEYRWFLGRGQSLWDEGGKPVRMSGSIHDITLRREAEEAYHSAILKSCDERARADAVIAGIGDGISIQDTDFKILYQNKVHKDMIGEHIGEYCYNVYEHKDDVCEGCPVEMAFGDGGVHTVERVLELEEGTRYFEITASPLKDVTGRITSSVEVVREITERKRAGEELAFRGRIIEDMAEGVFLIRASDGVIVFANPRFNGMFGYEDGELIGRHVSAINAAETEEDLGVTAGGIIAGLERDGVWKGEIRNVRKDGTKFWSYTGISTFEHHEYGTVWVAVKTDIDERKRAEEELTKNRERLEELVDERTGALKTANEALEKSEIRFRDVAEHSGEWIWEVDPEGRYTYSNSVVEKIIGYTPEETVGRYFYDFFVPSERDELKEFFFESYPKKEPFLNSSNNKEHKDGHTVICVTSGVPIIGKDGALLGYRGSVRDITELKKAEEERERILEELLQSQKMEAVGRLAGGIAHDFNNMMVAVKGLSSLGLKNVDKEDPVHAYFENIQSASERAIELTRKLTAFSRRQPTELAECALNSVVAKLLGMLPPLIIGEEIEIKTELEPHLRPVMADAGNLTQVLMNLVINARDAMEGGGSISIKTENATLDKRQTMKNAEARPGRFVRLTVIDTGSGMDKETVEHIFEPFYSTKDVGKGTGLGLSVAYGILKSHNGWIEVKSSPGKGTTFRVYLPSVDQEAGCVEKVEHRGEPEPAGGGERILLVEDEDLVRLTTKLILEQKGYHVVDAANSTDALDIFKREGGDFHLVLTDVVLPDLNGIELADEMASIKPGVRVILMSGYLGDRSQMKKIRQMGFQFIEKPYEVHGLLRVVRESIDAAEVK